MTLMQPADVQSIPLVMEGTRIKCAFRWKCEALLSPAEANAGALGCLIAACGASHILFGATLPSQLSGI
jgi:hypothetical protein